MTLLFQLLLNKARAMDGDPTGQVSHPPLSGDNPRRWPANVKRRGQAATYLLDAAITEPEYECPVKHRPHDADSRLFLLCGVSSRYKVFGGPHRSLPGLLPDLSVPRVKTVDEAICGARLPTSPPPRPPPTAQLTRQNPPPNRTFSTATHRYATTHTGSSAAPSSTS